MDLLCNLQVLENERISQRQQLKEKLNIVQHDARKFQSARRSMLFHHDDFYDQAGKAPRPILIYQGGVAALCDLLEQSTKAWSDPCFGLTDGSKGSPWRGVFKLP